MYTESFNAKVKHVTKTTSEWSTESTIVEKGILCIELASDGNTYAKVGDGSKTFANLPYLKDGSFKISDYYTSDETDSAISSAISALGNIITVKGVKSSSNELPSSGNTVGDLWFIGATGESTDNFSEYIWTTSNTWEFLGRVQTTVDLSGYVTTQVVDGLSDTVNTINGRVTTLENSAHLHTNKAVLDSITAIDTALSETSTNPVQNKVVNTAINNVNGTMSSHINQTSGNPHNVSKSDIGLGNVENKSSEDIRGELTDDDVRNALGYIPTNTVYATCQTGALVADKTAFTEDYSDETTFTLNAGTVVYVKFKNGNNVNNPTLNVNGSGAKPICTHGTTGLSWYYSTSNGDDGGAITEFTIKAGGVYSFVYDGVSWIIKGVEANSIYEHPTSPATAETSYRRVTTDMYGHVISGDNSTLEISEGGTGATTSAAAQYNILSDVSESLTPINDDNQVVFKFTEPSATKGFLLYKPISLIWTYIKSKITKTVVTDALGYTPPTKDSNVDMVLNQQHKAYLLGTRATPTTTTASTTSVADPEIYLSDVSGELVAKSFYGKLTNTDKNGTRYNPITDNGTNLWIGASQSDGYHHEGNTYISTGYDSTTGKGYDSIRISVPNEGNYSAVDYYAIHTGNYATYVAPKSHTHADLQTNIDNLETKVFNNVYGVPSNVIAEGTDLDTCTTAGCYICSSSTIGASLTNTPTTSAFRMDVVITTGTRTPVRVRQTIYPNDANGGTFVRNYNANGWSTWAEYRGTTETFDIDDSIKNLRVPTVSAVSTYVNDTVTPLQTDITNIQTDISNLEADVFGTPVARITSNTDMDTLVTAGAYVCANSTTAGTLTNCPTTYGFRLEVKYLAVGTTRYVQTIYPNVKNSVAFYTRRYTASGWTDWMAIGVSDTVTETGTLPVTGAAVAAYIDEVILNGSW